MKRLFTARMRLGMFDPPEKVPYAQTPESEIDSAAHRQLALKVARESMVLLKNDGVLPFAPSVKNILVVGPLAESVAGAPRQLQRHGFARHHRAGRNPQSSLPPRRSSYVPGTNFLRPKHVIPTSALSTSDGKPGLQGEYFAGANSTGTPQATRVDPIVDLQTSFIRMRTRSRSRGYERVFGALDRISDPG